MRNRVLLACLLGILPMVRAHADVVIQGSMDATMVRGTTQTFEVAVNATGSTNLSGEFTITVTSAAGLTLSGTTTTPPLPCDQRPNVARCIGNASLSPSQPIVIRQVILLNPDAVGYQSWTIQVSAGSSPAVKYGVINISDKAPKVILRHAPFATHVYSDGSIKNGILPLKNIGDADATVTVSVISGPIAIVDGPVFPVPAGKWGLDVVLGVSGNLPAGSHLGRVRVTGVGVSAGLQEVSILVHVFESYTPAGTPQPQPDQPRKYVGHPACPSSSSVPTMNAIRTTACEPVTDSIRITNSGSAKLIGAAASDSLWLIPQEELIMIDPGQTGEVRFTIDPAQRPDSTFVPGSVEGKLTLDYLLPASSAKLAIGPQSHVPATGSVSVTIVAVQKTTVSAASIPPLDQATAVFVPSVRRTTQGARLFITDFSFFSEIQGAAARPLALTDIYYFSAGSSTAQKATVDLVLPPQTAGFGDIIKSIFGADEQVGTLMIRGPSLEASWTQVRAFQFDLRNRSGTIGSTLPAFINFSGLRQPFEKIYLTGLRKDAGTTLQVYAQEMSGQAARADLTIRNSAGAQMAASSLDIPAFGLVQVSDASLPAGLATLTLSPATGSTGRFQAFALQTDVTSDDSWTVVDWATVKFYERSFQRQIVPVAGATPGANGTSFRTDVTVTNTGTFASTGVLSFYDESGVKTDRTISLGPSQSATYTNVTSTLFGRTTPHIGYLALPAPQFPQGPFAINARNYSVPAGSSGALATEIPVAGYGDIRRRIGGVDDAALESAAARHPGTFRSNFGIMEISGKPVTVKVTLHYRYPATKVEFTDSASKTYALAPNQFLFITKIAREILGAEVRDALGDLRNMAVDFERVSGEGEFLAFVSSVDNGTGDSIFRTE